MANPPGQNPLTKNVRLAIFEAGVSRAAVAEALGMKPRTLYNRLNDGHFTVTDLQKIADLTRTTINALLPDDAKAAS
jgi:transcriptional regulator with XRE-family HTH domain